MNKLTLNHYWKLSIHKYWVFHNITKICWALVKRGLVHDMSKFGKVERDGFGKFTPNLDKREYMDEGYTKDMMEQDFQVALQHHYHNNTHHPEYYKNGIKDMSLLDQIEMIADWAASVRRQKNGTIEASININSDRFSYGEFYKRCLDNTAIEAKLFSFKKYGKVMD